MEKNQFVDIANLDEISPGRNPTPSSDFKSDEILRDGIAPTLIPLEAI